MTKLYYLIIKVCNIKEYIFFKYLEHKNYLFNAYADT